MCRREVRELRREGRVIATPAVYENDRGPAAAGDMANGAPVADQLLHIVPIARLVRTRFAAVGTRQRAAVMVQPKNPCDPSHAHVTGHGDGQFEYLDRFQCRAQTLHERIIDRLVVTCEPIGVLQHELFTVGEE
jgi:hypothetical protein